MPPPQVPSLPRPRRRVEMLTAGYTDAEIRAALTGGRLTRLCTGSYVDTDPYAALPSDQQYLVRIRAEALRTPADCQPSVGGCRARTSRGAKPVVTGALHQARPRRYAAVRPSVGARRRHP